MTDEEQATPTGQARGVVERWLPGIAAIAFLVAFPFVADGYLLHVANISLIFILLAIGQNIITGYTGMLSLGHAAFYGVGAYTSALLTLRLGVSWPVAFLASGIVASIVGMLIALPCLRVRTDFLSLITIAFAQMFFVVANGWMDLTRGPMGLTGIPRISFGPWVAHNDTAYYAVFAVIVVVTYIAVQRILNSSIGRAWEMVRDDEVGALSLGVDVTYYKVLSFGVGTFLAGLAGSMFAHYIRFLSPDAFLLLESLIIMQMAILGGLASLPGSVLGAILLITIPEALRSSEPLLITYRPGLAGALLVAMMIWRPQGILGRTRATPPIIRQVSDVLRRLMGYRPAANP